MARPREFDTEEVLEKVMYAFLEKGLDGASMRYLESLTGVKQVSLYNAFGDKKGLFLAAFDRYSEIVAHTQESYLDNRGLDGIEALTTAIVTAESPLPYAQFGCLIVNTALVAEKAGAAVKERVERFRSGMKSRIVVALRRARTSGQLKPKLNLGECAELVVATFWGIFVYIRMAGGDPTVGKPAANSLKRSIRAWMAEEEVSAV